ncbi:MAG: hypothetical protein A2511_07835 [Deltaproteobacteria bacterium RIFOXYD12_FULL_50_9]|nr:MAG: hypothetical protein A2511_07835 [Deltaproteobacteria bacterium RIFOXYD12_FULL_50_9]
MSSSLPPDVAHAIAQLGERIMIARKRRAITMEEMADRMFISRKTLSRLEKGDTGVSIAIFVSALWVLGLEKDLLEVASPERDTVGIFRERQRLPQRVHNPESLNDLNF